MSDDWRKELKDVRVLFEKIEAAGYRTQAHGRLLVDRAQQANESLVVLEGELPKYEKLAPESTEIANALSQTTAWLAFVKRQAEESIALLPDTEKGLQSAASFAVTGVTATNTLFLSFASAVNLAGTNNPRLARIFEEFDLADLTILHDAEDSNELSLLLTREDPGLEKARLGAWETLASDSSDALSQAAHSMREVLRKLIAKYASNEKVMSWTVPGSTQV
jgi:BioD-like phosphotransacetylase family protein